MHAPLDREEYIEQAYFFRVLRERLLENVPTQTILDLVRDEILSITKLPMAIRFLSDELRQTGLLSAGFRKLPHYFTAFQAFVVEQTEEEKTRFSIEVGLQILEREAQYRSQAPTRAGLFVFHFETLCRNRLGYDQGLTFMRSDSFYDEDWRMFIELVRRKLGVYDFADLVFLRSEFHAFLKRRNHPEYVPALPVLFGEKEGKIANANRGKDPLYLFSALQRQLAYPEVPRQRPKDDPLAQIGVLKARIGELEQRLRLVEGEVKGRVDMVEFLAKNPKLRMPKDEDEE